MPRLFPLLIPLFAWCLSAPATATTIQSFTFDELAVQAEVVFEGRVIDVRVEESEGLIYTWVRFDVEDVVKGHVPGQELELRFLGGETLDASVRVAELEFPAEGERGIYFVESLEPGLVNPLLGWSQGRFTIERDGLGGEFVRAGEGGEIRIGGKEAALQEKLSGMKFGRSVLEAKTPATPAGLDPESFKDAVRQRLEALEK